MAFRGGGGGYIEVRERKKKLRFKTLQKRYSRPTAAPIRHIQKGEEKKYNIFSRGYQIGEPVLHPRPAPGPRLGPRLRPKRRAVAVASPPRVVRAGICLWLGRRGILLLGNALREGDFVRRPAVARVQRHGQPNVAELRGRLAGSPCVERGEFGFVWLDAPFFGEERGVGGVRAVAVVVVFLSGWPVQRQ